DDGGDGRAATGGGVGARDRRDVDLEVDGQVEAAPPEGEQLVVGEPLLERLPAHGHDVTSAFPLVFSTGARSIGARDQSEIGSESMKRASLATLASSATSRPSWKRMWGNALTSSSLSTTRRLAVSARSDCAFARPRSPGSFLAIKKTWTRLIPFS